LNDQKKPKIFLLGKKEKAHDKKPVGGRQKVRRLFALRLPIDLFQNPLT